MSHKLIAYGVSDFEDINAKNDLYVDKTMYISEIEKVPFIFLLRPRRFGKSLFLSMLKYYYDMNKKDDFDRLFHDTWIQENPTDKRATYMVLSFSFAGLDSQKGKILASFNERCNYEILNFLNRYKKELTQQLIDIVNSKNEPYQKIIALSKELKELNYELFIFIDEYDNFANVILSESRIEEYVNLTHSDGYLRTFFAALKEATAGALTRLFITGVSPITMDDVTSGMNIGKNISDYPVINEAFGLTKNEIEKVLDFYIAEGSFYPKDKELTLQLMKEYYNNYKFAKNAKEYMYNTCAVLNFLTDYFAFDGIPDELIDTNLKIDYKKLKSFVVLDRKLNGNFSVLQKVLTEGFIAANIVKSFPYEDLHKTNNFISLLFHFGMLTHTGKTKKGDACLVIPNETIKEMMYGYFRSSLQEAGNYDIRTEELKGYIGDMAYDGEFKPFFEFLAYQVEKQTKIRDYIAGEKVIQGFYLAYLNMKDCYSSCSEEELNKGYADLIMKPFWMKYQDIGYGYLCEFKYIKRIKNYDIEQNEKVEELNILVAEQIYNSQKQLAKYANDKNIDEMMHSGEYGNVKIKKIIVVFHAWEMIYLEEFSSICKT